MAPRERNYDLINFDFDESSQPYVLYIEKIYLKARLPPYIVLLSLTFHIN